MMCVDKKPLLALSAVILIGLGFVGSKCSEAETFFDKLQKQVKKAEESINNAQTIEVPLGVNWTGTYNCLNTDGVIRLSLSSNGGAVHAIAYTFPPRINGDHAEFEMEGTYDLVSGALLLAPVRWILNPGRGVTMIGLKGNVQRNGSVFTGTVNYSGCGGFSMSHILGTPVGLQTESEVPTQKVATVDPPLQAPQVNAKQNVQAGPVDSRTSAAPAAKQVTVAPVASQTAESKNMIENKSKQSSVPPKASSNLLRSDDVYGIKIRMGVSEVSNALKAKFPTASNFPVNFDKYGAKWTGLYASLPSAVTKSDNNFNKKADELMIVDFAYPPSKQEALAVVRFKSYVNDKTPSLAATEKSIAEKYGPWTKVTENRDSNYYFWGADPRTGNSCIPVKLVDPVYRLSDLIEAQTSQAVICQAYGKWDQCLKPARNFFESISSVKGCGIQAAAFVRYSPKESKETSPVSQIETLVVDLDGIAQNEVDFADFSSKYEREMRLRSIDSGGKPTL